MDIWSQSVVVFSKNYLPVNRIGIKRAIALLVTDKAEPLHLDGDRAGQGWIVRSPSLVLQVPQYIRLTNASAEGLWKIPAANRREILRRDRHTCQYCGSGKNLTLDHVVPKSKGGRNDWDNLVAACNACNARKGDRTPAEAGMILRRSPRPPVHPVIAFAEQFWRDRGERSL